MHSLLGMCVELNARSTLLGVLAANCVGQAGHIRPPETYPGALSKPTAVDRDRQHGRAAQNYRSTISAGFRPPAETQGAFPHRFPRRGGFPLEAAQIAHGSRRAAHRRLNGQTRRAGVAIMCQRCKPAIRVCLTYPASGFAPLTRRG
jgi:hypothetical protein